MFYRVSTWQRQPSCSHERWTTITVMLLPTPASSQQYLSPVLNACISQCATPRLSHSNRITQLAVLVHPNCVCNALQGCSRTPQTLINRTQSIVKRRDRFRCARQYAADSQQAGRHCLQHTGKIYLYPVLPLRVRCGISLAKSAAADPIH